MDPHYFPLWLRLTHLFNFVFIILMMRSGVQILADHPKLYWNDDSTPGSEWWKFGNKEMPKDKLWTSADEAVAPPPGIGLPGGRRNLGPGRRWHFLVALSWILNGLIYIVLLFATGLWWTLLPTDASRFVDAWQTLVAYFHFQMPPAEVFTPFDPLQGLVYAGIVFVVAPLLILTALAMSPAVIGRFPWYPKLFGGRQAARSIHFLSMLAILAFTVVHVILVFTVHYPTTVNSIVFGDPTANGALATAIIAGTVLAIFLFNIWVTWVTIKHERGFQLIVDRILDPVEQLVLSHLPSRQRYTTADISPFYRVNGYPPDSGEYKLLAAENFADWELRVDGLVHRPLLLSLADLKSMPKLEQITKHNCIQGWSAIAEWGGVSLSYIMDLAKVKPEARYVVFIGFDNDAEGRPYHESLRVWEARMPQTILAYEMNGEFLPIPHGAPLRLRAESRLGYKMVKYLREIRFVESLKEVEERFGGTHEKLEYYDNVAAI
jgi:thiosulfate reductase cytochrome b subunit